MGDGEETDQVRSPCLTTARSPAVPGQRQDPKNRRVDKLLAVSIPACDPGGRRISRLCERRGQVQGPQPDNSALTVRFQPWILIQSVPRGGSAAHRWPGEASTMKTGLELSREPGLCRGLVTLFAGGLAVIESLSYPASIPSVSNCRC